MIQLLHSRATRIKLINNTVRSQKINIETKHSFSVSFAEDGEHCRAFLQIGVTSQGDPNLLNIECVVEGSFSFPKISGDEDKKIVHVECYYNLFPYAQALLARLFSDAALPPYYFPYMQMTPDNVVIKK